MTRRKSWWVIGFALSVAGPAARAAPASEIPARCADRLEEALQQLVDLPASQWRFVVLEDKLSGHFIQYAWWDGIVVDLPLAALDEAQQARAAGEFARLGVNAPVKQGGPDGSGVETETFQIDFARDTAAAARFGCAVMPRIYELEPERTLSVTLGGD